MGLSTNEVMVMLVVAAIITPPFILLVPHARQSAAFDRLLIASTFLVAFLGEWLAMSQWNDTDGGFVVAQVPILPVATGALGGAVVLNLVLWVLDWFDRPEIGEPEEDSSEEC